MNIHSVTNNYISCFDTSSGVYSFYRDNIAIFEPNELSEIIFPGLFHELKTHTKISSMFENTFSAPSLYEIPSYIHPDKLTQNLRILLSKTLVFIHTWFEYQTNTESSSSILDDKYNTYVDFFDNVMKYIISNENDAETKDNARELYSDLRKYYQYFGPYHGNFRGIIHKTREILKALFLIMCIASI
jgi:hypothetical protein